MTENVQPRLIHEPEVLYDQNGWLVWHSGIADGPLGINLVVDVIDLSGAERIDDTWWPDEAGDHACPIEVTITDAAGRTTRADWGSSGGDNNCRSTVIFGRYGRHGRRLGPRPSQGPLRLDVVIHPLRIRVTRMISA